MSALFQRAMGGGPNGPPPEESEGRSMARAETRSNWGHFLGTRTHIGGTRRLLRLLVAATLAVALAGCTEGDKPSPPSAARVNGQNIPVSQVSDALARFEATDQFDQLAKQGGPAAARRQYESMYLGQQIKRLVLKARAEELGIDIADEVAARIKETSSAYPSDKEFKKALEDGGYTVAEFTALIEDQVLEEKLRDEVTAEVAAESEPSDEEVAQYYRSHRDSYHQTKVQHILVKDMAEARELATELEASSPDALGALFAELAGKHSTDTSNADQGGALGWVSPGELVSQFESAMDELDIGEVSAPVRSDFGVHVIFVTGRRQQSLEDVSAEISEQIQEMSVAQAWSEWLQNAYKSAAIEVNPRYGKLDPATGQIVTASAENASGASASSSE
jgi:foldase protein PrsA